jgi:CheY-like chemotaxis protein
MTTAEIPPIVLLVEPHRESLECYSRIFEDAGLWVAGTTAYDELLTSVDELRPDIIIVDAGTEADAQTDLRRRAALDEVKHNPQYTGVPLVVLVPARVENTPDADVTLRKPVPAEFLLRRTREILARSREVRARSNDLLARTQTLRERSERLTKTTAGIAPDVDRTRRVCPSCSASLDWVESGTIGGVTYDYFRWCRKGCGLYCFNRDSRTWIRLA